MNKEETMYNFINKIQSRRLLTNFIAYLFDYQNFHDYNYIFRLSKENKNIIIDIYDNISNNRFNRYIFSFSSGEYSYKTKEVGNVFITKIYINNIEDDNTKLHKLAYLFKLDKTKMLEYAKTFLDKIYINILNDIIK